MNNQTVFQAQPYKGTRDFYPEDLEKRNFIFNTWRKTFSQWGFSEYETSLLENADLYIAKSGQELGGSQLYNFHDKGGRFIALRPEQTPSLARIIANKFGEQRFPLRWFSIPNCFRYEQPQKGRFREHWQVNTDIIGLEVGLGDLEILVLAGNLFKAFGATNKHFKVMFNHRQVLDLWLEQTELTNYKELIYKTLDNWFKLSLEANIEILSTQLNREQIDKILEITSKNGEYWDLYIKIAKTFPEISLILENINQIHSDLEYDFNPCIIRGIAYYTGIVFEVFDKHPENNRALMGGGRYDNLMELFGKQAPAIGFGCGDATFHEFLTNWELYPNFDEINTKVGIMLFDQRNLFKLYNQIIPEIQAQNKVFEIDYDYQRSENKRWDSLKKKGCSEIIKLK